MKRIFPGSFYNLITLIGVAIAGLSIGVIVFMVLLEATSENPNPYMGIFAFTIVPVFLVIGLIMIPIGIRREHRRERLGKPHGLHLPVIDFNNPRHRTAVTAIAMGTLLVLSVIGFTSFK